MRRLNQLADAAHSAVALRDLEALGSIVADSWRANTLIHRSTSNDEIERLLDATREHFTGAKLLGAGGGGYMLFVSPSVEAAQTLRGILRREFENERARLVDMSLNRHGLQVSVS